MASNYPGSLDSFDTIASDKKTSDSVGGRTHRQMHNDLGDAIEAVQGELGTTPSGSYATVKARFEAIEGSTLPQVDAKGDLIVGTADNTYDNLGVGTNDTVLLAASGETKGVKWAQVPTAAIQDSAVTSAKIADGTIATGDLADGAVTPAKLATTGRFTFPTGAANGYGFASGAVHLSGTGTPEGVVTAAPGSSFLQIGDAVTVSGNLLWRKISGTGNTGWVPEGALADTGWRAIAVNGSGWSGNLLVRRRGATVDVGSDGLTMAATATITTNVPTGFWPSIATTGPAFNNWTGAALVASISVATISANPAAGLTEGRVLTLGGSYPTADAWPSSLPGSAA